MQSAESRLQSAEQARSVLDAEDGGVLDGLRTAVSKLKNLKELDPQSLASCEALERALFEAEDASQALSRYVDAVDMNPERLAEVQERLALIADLKRKYGSSVADVLRAVEGLEQELHANENADQRIAEIDAAAKTLEKAIREKGKALFDARKKAAKLFSDSVTGELKDLNMSDAEFRSELSLYEQTTEWLAHGGPCAIQFTVQTNRGETPRPLGKIASGGELSRMMLAIRRVISDRGGIGVYLFDEIDAGIGGSTAFQVGKKLKSVSQYNQVICITHVPQVAAFADHHLSVRKSASGKRTVTEVEALDKKERQEEIARMLGGAEVTKSSLKNASELMISAAR